MRFVFIDESVPYDGYTSLRRPLGGPEKAVASLAAALSQAQHDVTVVNRAPYAHMADGAYWVPFGDSNEPRSADVLIAVRKPSLLGKIRNADQRILWVTGSPDYLTAPANEKLWDSFAPSVMFLGSTQAQQYKGKLKSVTVPPGVRSAYFETTIDTSHLSPEELVYAESAMKQATRDEAPKPHAIVTTHPLHGLDWLIDVWARLVHPRLPEARLSVYSAVLSKGIRTDEVPDAVVPVFEQVKAASEANVVVVDPRNDEGMADVYRTSRVHLYPGHARDFACWTLVESQAAGLPAVARSLGGADERIVNGQTGYTVPDAEAFANVALQILGDDGVFKSLSDAAGAPERRRTWPEAALDVNNFIAQFQNSRA
jgi:glycosyltransferase involved in cell wall biosynthesis